MRRDFLGAVVVWLLLAQPAHAQFVGDLELAPTNCQNSGICTLVKDFGFIDPRGVGWQAQAGLKTDGASIPGWAQPLVGGRFDEAFIKAAVIHDHYCIRHVRSFLDTHRVFYDALIASGVDPVKANTMYYAVLVGGPKWITVISGQPCRIGSNCVQYFGGQLNLPGAKIVNGEGGDRFAWRDAIYSRQDVQDEIREGARLIEQRGLRDPSEALLLARQRRPSDVFLGARSALILDESADR
ncbi:DUF1353 domain-containing protein [Novosphingobium sp.]|uniref:DUF1353 domain-containing protein n=1 Tax=Novosphingobium sp. TaxID=1874826 RepID=UPI002FDB36E2